MSEVENSKGFLHHLILNKGAGVLQSAPAIVAFVSEFNGSNSSVFNFLFVAVVLSIILNICDAEYLKFHGYSDKNFIWKRFVTPLYIQSREQLLGRDKQAKSLIFEMVFGLVIICGIILFFNSTSIENRSCEVVNQILEHDYNSEAECDRVELEEIVEDYYLGTAYLDNDESIDIAVVEYHNGDIRVEFAE